MSKHDEANSLICVSYFKWESRVTPKSFTENSGYNVLFRKFSVSSSGNVPNNCGVPNNINLVLSGFKRREFVQHHLVTLLRSSSNASFAFDISWMEKDKETLLSSTYESREHSLVAERRSLV